MNPVVTPAGDVYVPREEIEAEHIARHAVWLAPTVEIAGIECRPLTPRTWIALQIAGSPIIQSSRSAKLSDLAMFVWFLSDHYQAAPGPWWRRMFSPSPRGVVARAVAKDPKAAFRAADELVEQAFRDFPRDGSADEGLPDTSVLSDIIDLLAAEYGWLPDQILDLPLGAVWQLYRCILRRKAGAAGARARSITPAESKAYAAALDAAANMK